MVEAFGLSDLGCVRTNNEDYYLLAPNIGLYVVADGMGGAAAGELASKLAAEKVWEVVYNAGSKPSLELLANAFEEANNCVMREAASDSSLDGMGTTLVCALEAGEEVLVASVGDSRAYLYRNEQLEPITTDQTWVEEVGRRLGIDEENLRNHPMRHVLTMAIGVSPQLRINTYRVRAQAGSQMLLCSDGLHGVVSETVISRALSGNGGLDGKCSVLIQAARDAGGPDNVTAVLLQIPATLAEPSETVTADAQPETETIVDSPTPVPVAAAEKPSPSATASIGATPPPLPPEAFAESESSD